MQSCFDQASRNSHAKGHLHVLIQAVVRGRKLRQQLSQARQAATYKVDSYQHDSHDSDLNMDQMDDFLASLLDDDPSPAPSQASTSSQDALQVSVPMSVHAVASPAEAATVPAQALQSGSSSLHPQIVTALAQSVDPRKCSHAAASISGRHASSSQPYAASLFALHSQSSIAAAASSPGGSVSRSPSLQKIGGNLFGGQGPLVPQQQQAMLLPAFIGHQDTPAAQTAVMQPHTGLAPIPEADSSSSHFSLPSVHHPPDTAATTLVAPSIVPHSIAAVAAAGDNSDGGLQELTVGSSGISSRVSRASSSVRSEQSTSSQSPEKVAAKEQRHKV